MKQSFHIHTFMHLLHRAHLAVIGFLVFVGVLLLNTADFYYHLNRYALDSSQQILQNSIESNLLLLSNYLNRQLSYVQQAAAAISSFSLQDSAQTQKILTDFSQQSDFTQMWVINLDKKAFSSHGRITDFSASVSLDDAFAGNSGFSKLYQNPLQQDNLFFLYAPVRISPECPVNGAVVGILSAKQISQTLNLYSFAPDCHTAVFQSDGTLLYVGSSLQATLEQNLNFWDSELGAHLHTQLQNDDSPHSFSLPGMKEPLFYMHQPIGIRDWYIYQDISERALLSGTKQEHTFMLSLFLKLLVSSALIVLILTLYQRRHDTKMQAAENSLRTINRSLNLALEHASITLYIYDLSTGIMTSYNSPNEQGRPRILPRGPFTMVDSGAVAPQHIDDFLALFEQIPRTSSVLEKDLLLRSPTSSGYFWSRVTLTAIAKVGKPPSQAIVTFEDISETLRRENELRLRSFQDALTGLLNRSGLRHKVEELLKQPSVPSASALLLIDLDHFKEVNDTLGHPAGDLLLQKTAALLLNLTDQNSICVRFGGDEFMILLPDSSWPAAESLAARICAQLPSLSQQLSLSVPVGASIGVHLFDLKAESIQEVYKKTDAALYTAKKKRGCWVSTRRSANS